MKIRLKELHTGYALEKRVSKLSPKQRAISIIALTLVGVFLITFLFSAIGILPFDAIAARVSTGLFGGGKNYPVAVESDTVINMGIIGDNVLLLTDKMIIVYDTNGNVVFSEKHSFSRPAFTINDNRGVVFDRNEIYRIENYRMSVKDFELLAFAYILDIDLNLLKKEILEGEIID